MIISIRRAGLVLSIISALGVRVAAQNGDAAFGAALGQALPALTAKARAQESLPQQPEASEPQAPAAPDAVWQKVLEAVKNDGKFKPASGRTPAMFVIEDSTGDAKADHEAQTVSIYGSLNEEKLFEAKGAVFTLKLTTHDQVDGYVNIDQWFIQTDIYGEIVDAGHRIVVERADGKSVSAMPQELDPSDPRLQAHYDEMLKHWAERTPKGA